MTQSPSKMKYFWFYVAVLIATAGATAGVTALLLNISERKAEERTRFVRLIEVTEDTTDPAKWGVNWPKQYDTYKLTAQATRTRFGGHGGSEALPAEKIERDPWLKRIFLGYAFSIDYRDRRGHAYMLQDQEQTQRQTKPQSGSCLHCHASVMPLYRKLGDGDAVAGFEKTYNMSYAETNKVLHDIGHAHPVSCVDCHDPETMGVRVTRPGLLQGMEALASGDGPVPHLPLSALAGRPPQRTVRHQQGRHANGAALPGLRPVSRGVLLLQRFQAHLSVGQRADRGKRRGTFGTRPNWRRGSAFSTSNTRKPERPILKAQHPEFELWSQGIHARSGVACADCHMPYMRDGATKVSDHWVRSPLLNINRACQTCHKFSEEELKTRVENIQERNYKLLQNAGTAMVDLIEAVLAARAAGATDTQLAPVLEFQRAAQWRLDFVAAENSMGFHAPQEAARILGEAADMARQGQIKAISWRTAAQPAPAVAPQTRDHNSNQ